MKFFLRIIRDTDSFTVFSILSAMLLIYISVESSPWSHSINRDLYFFLNSFFGYKFFAKHISFFFSDIIILVMFGICVYHHRNRPLTLNRSSKYFFLFVLTLVISLCFSSFKITSSQCFMILNFFTTFLFFFSVVTLVNKNNIHKYLKIVFLGLLLISFFEAFTGIYQYLMQKAMGMKMLHESNFLITNLSLARFDSEGGSRWIFDNLLNVKRNTHVILRAMGTLPHANVYGGFMFFSTLSTVYLYLFSNKKWFSATVLIVLFLQIFSIWVSFSRAAIFGFLLALTLLFLLTLFKNLNNAEIEKRRIRKFIAFSALFFFISFIFLFPQVNQRGGVISYPPLTKSSDKGRVYCQSIAWQMIKKRPVTGIGFNNFFLYKDKYIVPDLKSQQVPQMVHNIFFLVASEEGLLGLTFFLLFIYSIYRASFRRDFSVISLIFLVYFTVLIFLGFIDFYMLFLPQGKFILFFPAAVISSLGYYEIKANKRFAKVSEELVSLDK